MIFFTKFSGTKKSASPRISRKEWNISIRNSREKSSSRNCPKPLQMEFYHLKYNSWKMVVSFSTSCSCNGGDPMAAWRFWVSDGIVTGSNYTEHSGCRPYPFPPCEHHSNKTHYQPCKHDLYPTPKCDRKCSSGYGRSYKSDKYYGMFLQFSLFLNSWEKLHTFTRSRE